MFPLHLERPSYMVNVYTDSKAWNKVLEIHLYQLHSRIRDIVQTFFKQCRAFKDGGLAKQKIVSSHFFARYTRFMYMCIQWPVIDAQKNNGFHDFPTVFAQSDLLSKNSTGKI